MLNTYFFSDIGLDMYSYLLLLTFLDYATTYLGYEALTEEFDILGNM